MKKISKILMALSLIFTLNSCNIIFGSTSSNTSSSSTNTITDAKPSSIEVSPKSVAVVIGNTHQLNASVYPLEAKQDVVWKSSKLNIATVDEETGLVTAKAIGVTKIYAYAKENQIISDYCTLTVASEVIEATSLSLDKHEVELNLDQTLILHATLEPTNSTGGVQWSSSDESIVAVNNSGKLTATGFGEATIKATASSNSTVYDECKVTVKKVHVDTVALEKHSLEASTGSTINLTANVLPTNANDKSLTWTSSNTEVASIINDGEIRCLKAGETIITVTSNDNNNAYDSLNLSVIDVHPTSFSLSKSSLSLTINSTATLETIFVPENTSNKNVIWESENENVATINNGVVTAINYGTTSIKATTEDGNLKSTCVVTVEEIAKQEMNYLQEDLSDHSVYQIDAIPSTGSPKMIVIPIWFTDSTNYISTSEKTTVKEDIAKAYFGTNEETGWRSVKTYYQEESHNKLTLDGVVTDWYSCGYRSSSVSESNTTSIVKNATNWFKTNNPDTYNDYDTNNDGYLDALVLIYAAPDYISSSSKNDNLWAYCYWIQESNNDLSNPIPNVFFWASYDFMYGRNNPKVGSYGGGDTRYCNIDTHTYIHEMGHIFGLNDYYDYNNGYSAAGGFSMQDYNVGGHDPYSVMSLGWASPYVPVDTITIEINPFQQSGDLILLSPNFRNSPFDEYLLIELYTPTGLNEFDANNTYQNAYPQGPSLPGCRIWHVDARLATYQSKSFVLETDPSIYETKQYVNAFTNSTFVSSDDGRGSVLASSSTDSYANYRELQLIRKNYLTDPKCDEVLSYSNLFVTGDTFDMNTYAKVFYNNGKLNNGKQLGYRVSFDSVTSTKATITITKG